MIKISIDCAYRLRSTQGPFWRILKLSVISRIRSESPVPVGFPSRT